ncbi:E1-E2 ATPase-domain-containing protein, partial [Pisolithus sp. B1]
FRIDIGEPDPEVFVLGVAILLIFVIAISATFYTLVDWNAARLVRSVKTLIAEQACVIRDGQQQHIPTADIVVGDVVILNSGDRVPADLRVVQTSADLRFDRSILTGERCALIRHLRMRWRLLTSYRAALRYGRDSIDRRS